MPPSNWSWASRAKSRVSPSSSRNSGTEKRSPIDGGWPRGHQTPAGTVTVYQPQLESWDGHRLAVYVAIALR